MTKLLCLAPYRFLPPVSGGHKAISQLYTHLAKKTSLICISTRSNGPVPAAAYPLLPVLSGSFTRYFNPLLFFKIRKVILRQHITHLMIEHPYYGWLGWLLKKTCKIKLIIRSHNIEYQRFRSLGKWWWRLLYIYERWTHRRADYSFFITEEEREWVVSRWKIKREKTMEVAYGIENNEPSKDKSVCRQQIAAKHGIAANEKILLFNGQLSYGPNLDALLAIVNHVNPYLLAAKDFCYKIIICGKGLPEDLHELKDYESKNIIYAGFVDDIETYFKGSDLFLNTVQSGGGIKTKMVEAIGFGTTVVATESGARGIHRNICGDKLVVVADNDWQKFATAVIHNKSYEAPTPAVYYQHYYWGNVVKKITTAI